MAGLSVMLAMPTHRDLPPETVGSLLATQLACFERGIDLQVYFGKGSSLVHHSRSKIAWHFLQTDYARLFWIDSDQEWSPDAFLRLLALSSVKDIVTATYPFRRDPIDFFVEFDGDQVEADEYGCLPVKRLGLGFTCLQRHVVEELAAKAPLRLYRDINNGEPIPRIFRMADDGMEDMGEDVAFFEDVRALGYRVDLDPTVQIGHIGQKVWRARLIDALTPSQETA